MRRRCLSAALALALFVLPVVTLSISPTAAWTAGAAAAEESAAPADADGNEQTESALATEPANLRPLSVRAFLPDGTEFLTWEPEELAFSKTYYVDQRNPLASDQNPGTEDMPFLTINQAARVLRPGERAVVSTGVYREWVNPVCGGTDPGHMISYEAAPGADVVIKGSDILDAEWIDMGLQTPPPGAADSTQRRIWRVRLPRELFDGYNPFAMINYPQVNELGFWDMKTLFAEHDAQVLLRVRGLIFQDGRPLEQVDTFSELSVKQGTFWVDLNGLVLCAVTYGDADPNLVDWEITTREQCFAPQEQELNYIRVKGFTMECAGNGFPFPQRGLLSTTLGTYWIIEDNTIRWANSIGMDIGMQGTGSAADYGHQIVRRNTISDCGICGIAGAPLRDTIIEDNLLRHNAWHDIEWMAECAAMKFHWGVNLLIRRNLIVDIPHGSGIYVDCQNENVRITQNTVIGCGSLTNAPGPGQGAVYLEATSGPAMVDNNFIWGSTKANGIYGYFSGNTTITHNLIGRCVAGGIVMLDEIGRPAGNVGGDISIKNNILVDNGWNIDLLNKYKNASDYNLFGAVTGPKPALEAWAKSTENVIAVLKNTTIPSSYWNVYDFRINAGAFNYWKNAKRLSLAEWQSQCSFDQHSVEAAVTAELNTDTLELTWAVQGGLPACPFVAGSGDSFFGWMADTRDAAILPGPFGVVPLTLETTVVDPRRLE